MKRFLLIATLFVTFQSHAMHTGRALSRIAAVHKKQLFSTPHRGFGLCPDEESQRLMDEISALRDRQATLWRLAREMNINGACAIAGVAGEMLYVGEEHASSVGILVGYGLCHGFCRFNMWRIKSDLQKSIEAKEAKLDAIARETGIIHYRVPQD